MNGREWQTEFKNVKKNHDFIGAIYFVCIFLYAIFGSWMDYFVTVLCIVWICCFDSRNFNFLCFETKDSLSCGKYNLYIIYTGDVIITAWIDIFPCRNVPASFMPLLLIVTPTVFVLRFRLIIPLMAIVDLVYSIVALWYKVPRIAQSDVFTAFIGLVLGYMMTLTIVQLRIRDNNAKREYQRRCMVDPVTGILNKFSFENSLRDTLNARDETHECALLLVDIDNMKRMNDELGKLVGDMFLENVAEFLTSIFRGSDIIGRVGGDEFMVYVRNLKSEDWLAGKCSRIQHEIKTISNENGNINMTCSIGAAVAGKVPVSFEQMYTQADDSLYKAKTRGRGKYVLHYVHKEREVIH